MILTLEVVGEQAGDLGASGRKVFHAVGGTIGRLPDNDWVFPDPYVSGRHALIRYLSGKFFVEDTSTNGVFLNSPDNRLQKSQPHALKDGDLLFLDAYRISVSIESEMGAASENVDTLAMLKGKSPSPPPMPAARPAVQARPPAPPPPLRPPAVAAVSPPPPPPSALARKSPPAAEETVFLPVEEDRTIGMSGSIDEDDEDARDERLDDEDDHRTQWIGASKPALIDDQKTEWFGLKDAVPPREPPAPVRPRVPPARPVAQMPAEPRPAAVAPPPPKAAPPPEVVVPPPKPPAPVAARPTPPPAPAPAPVTAAPAKASPVVAAREPAIEREPARLPARAAGAPHSDDAMMRQMLSAAGIVGVEPSPELAQTVGEILRVAVAGLMEVQRARERMKDELRVRGTIFKPAHNNPLKFSANVEDAFHNLLLKHNAAYLDPTHAFEEALHDVRDHHAAVLGALRLAFESMLAQFDPGRMQEEFDRQMKKGSILGVPVKLRYWDLYRDKYSDMVKDADTSFRHLFGDKFANEYEEQLERLKVHSRDREK